MADTMQVDVVSPERRLASLTATAVQIPGADGDLTAMPDHAPLITSLRPGLLTVTGPDGTSEFLVTGGFAEISGEGTAVLAEKAMSVTEATAADLDAMVEAAEEAAEGTEGDARDVANKLLADLAVLRANLGL